MEENATFQFLLGLGREDRIEKRSEALLVVVRVDFSRRVC